MNVDWLTVAVIAAILMGALGVAAFSRISRRYPAMYQSMGRPSLIDWYQFAVIKLLRSDRFASLAFAEQVMVVAYIASLAVFTLTCVVLLRNLFG